MLRKISVGLLAGAAMMAAAPAMAQASGDYDVNVNIEVAPNVSLWTGHDDVDLLLDGGAENSDAFQSSLHHINNVAADITVEVAGILPPPVPSGPQAGNAQVNFFIFDQVTAPDALTAIVANSNNPAGALKWTATGGAPQLLTAVGVSPDISNRILTYAASAPNYLPDPDEFALVVTFTITES